MLPGPLLVAPVGVAATLEFCVKRDQNSRKPDRESSSLYSRRLLDLSAGSIFLILSLPVLLAIAWAMRLTGDDGPFLSRPTRRDERHANHRFQDQDDARRSGTAADVRR